MGFRQYDYDPNPNSDQALNPHGYDFWNPAWKIGEDGKVIKTQADDMPKVESAHEEKGDAYFQCNQCDFKTDHEPSMKSHVTRKHKKDLQ